MGINGYACLCITQKIEQNYKSSSFVAKIKILNTYKPVDSNKYFKADILIEDSYKGEMISSIYFYGVNEKGWDSACYFHVEKEENLVVFAARNSEGNYVLEACSRILYLDRANNNESYDQELEILKVLKSKKVNFNNDIKFTSESFGRDFRKYYGINLKKDFAIYELTFDEKLKVKCVKKVESFNGKIDRKIIKLFKSKKWSSTVDYVKDKIPKNSKHLVVVYYKVNSKDGKGYLTLY